MAAVDYHYGNFPPSRLELERIVSLIGHANAAIARYDGVLSAVPNANVLLSPLTTHEAVLSSRIEGTQATVLEFEARGDIAEGYDVFVSHETTNMRHNIIPDKEIS
ncbi:MAG: hypothetical protein HQL02_06380 [Nitrospirae bacterium]|nr:hypothetical protein [Nitrospirota bacterium]